MRRFYVPDLPEKDIIIITDPERVHHIREVLRLRAGDEVTVFDGRGTEYLCTIKDIENNLVKLRIMSSSSAIAKIMSVTIACAVPKKTRMDDIVDKLTQLGVDSIIPMITERVIVKMDETARVAKLARWRKIAESAIQQSQRGILPIVAPVTSFDDVLKNSGDFDLKLMPTLAGEKRTLKDVLSASRPKRIIILIGPEGDFAPQEIEQAFATGFIPVSLGNTVLRVDTAAVAVAAYIMMQLG